MKLILKPVRFYNLLALLKYLSIRYKVFIKELGRSIFGEFYKDDFFAQHYVLKEKNNIIGTIRILYLENKIAIIGRVAILKNYRNQGYGALMINQAIELIKLYNRANIVRLFTENKKVEFFKKLGFIEECEVHFNGVPYVQLSLTI